MREPGQDRRAVGATRTRRKATIALVHVVLATAIGWSDSGGSAVAADDKTPLAVVCEDTDSVESSSMPVIVERPLCRIKELWESEPHQDFPEAVARVLVTSGISPARATGAGECLRLVRHLNRAEVALSMRECLASLEVDLARTENLGPAGELDAALGLRGTLRPTGPTAGGARGCGGSRVDSRLAQQSQQWDFASWPHSTGAPPDPTDRGDWASFREYQTLDRNADLAWQEYTEALEREIGTWEEWQWGNGTKENWEAARQETQRALEAANRAIEERNLWLPKVAAEQGNDGVLPTDDSDTAVADLSTDGWIRASQRGSSSPTALPEDGTARHVLCSSINCSRATPHSCSSIQTKAAPAARSTSTTTARSTCSPDTDTLEAVMTEICWSRIQPAGPDEDPCAPPNLDGAIIIAAGPFDPCTDPAAMTTPDDGTCRGEDGDPVDVAAGLAHILNRQKDAAERFISKLERMCGSRFRGPRTTRRTRPPHTHRMNPSRGLPTPCSTRSGRRRETRRRRPHDAVGGRRVRPGSSTPPAGRARPRQSRQLTCWVTSGLSAT